jgi:DNA-directed RNA polymerase
LELLKEGVLNMDKTKIKTIKMLLSSIKGITSPMLGHPIQHESIEKTITAITEILDREEDKETEP